MSHLDHEMFFNCAISDNKTFSGFVFFSKNKFTYFTD